MSDTTTTASLPHSDLIGKTVWVLRYSHRHGDDITVHATSEGADAAIAEIVRMWWGDEMRGEDGVPETPDGLSDTDAVAEYFAHQDGRSEPESYEIKQAPVFP